MMAGGIHANRWRSYIRDIFRILRPGGWCQMVEIYFNAQSDNGSLTAGESQAVGLPWSNADQGQSAVEHALSRWSSNYLSSMQPYKDPRAPLQLSNWMRSAGFTEIESRLLMLPMCAWSRSMLYLCHRAYAEAILTMPDTRDNNIGAANSTQTSELLHSLALYPVTHFKE
jgi:hypothetical protein